MIKSSVFTIVGFFLFLSLGLGKESGVSGKVVDINGQPIEGVRVEAYHDLPSGGVKTVEVTTDASGSFAVNGVGRAVAFYKDGFQPAAVLLKADTTTVTISLKPGAPTAWPLSECTQEKRGRRYGEVASFYIPSRAKVEAHHGEDTADAVVSFPGNKKEKMLIWYGIMMAEFSVPEQFIINASPLSMREIGIRGVFHGTDARGTDKSGKQWRFVGIGDEAEYRGVSKDAAQFFDQIIDSACVPSDEPKRTAVPD